MVTVNVRGSRLDSADYHPVGKLPILDQSKARIAGYTDLPLTPIKPGPEGMIVFGDHTCISKFVDFDFVVGADGTKVLRATPASGARLRFLAYVLEFSPVSSTGYNRHFSALRKRSFRVPSISEQDVIVEALRDADDAITSLERLISKKQEIKQGMMQQLLTGETRLPGFSGDWVGLDVAENSHLKARIGWQGLSVGEYRDVGEYGLIGGTNFANGRVDWSSTPFVDKWRFDQDSNIQVRNGDILITKDGSIGKIAFVEDLPGPSTLNSGVFVLRPKDQAYDSGFLFFLFRSRAFDEFVSRLSAGSTISHLYQRDLAKLRFNVPPSLAEQKAIAEALFDVDVELSLLQKRLKSTRDIKQGMMQELLTGRTRLTSAGV